VERWPRWFNTGGDIRHTLMPRDFPHDDDWFDLLWRLCENLEPLVSELEQASCSRVSDHGGIIVPSGSQIAALTMSAVSSIFWSALVRALRKSAPFRSRWRCAKSNQSSLAITVQVWNSVRPVHLFDRSLDHDS
jgi:hypothetical protein